MAQDAPGGHPLGYRQGHPVVVMEDGHEWGREECPPKFWIVKLPGVPVEKLLPFLDDDVQHQARQDSAFGIVPDLTREATMRRAWQIQVAKLDAATLHRVASAGVLTIKVPGYGYDGPHDFQWWQVKPVLKNTVTGLNESFDL